MLLLNNLNQLVGCVLHPPMEYAVQPDLSPGPCPHCGGELEYKASVASIRVGSEIHFSRAKAATIFIRLRAIDITTPFDTGLLRSGTRHK